MPPSGLATDKNWQIVTYLRNLTAVAFDSTAPGDVQAGRSRFFGKAQCVNCRSYDSGARWLSGSRSVEYRAVRSFRQLRESLLDPDVQIAEGIAATTVTTKSGNKISGVARDDTNYAIHYSMPVAMLIASSKRICGKLISLPVR